MIGIIFQFGGEVVEAKINGTAIFFRTSTYGSQFVSIDSLYFSKEGVIKEYPDLKDNPQWKVEAINRFKEKLKGLASENKISEYLITDLEKFGYVAKYKQKQGHRVEVLNHAI